MSENPPFQNEVRVSLLTLTESAQLRKKITDAVEKLITEHGVDTFLFGSKSRFDSLCLEMVTALKESHTHIKRIYVRAEFPVIDEDYTAYLLQCYDETYFPERLLKAGRAVYVERNREMINRSRYCIVCYDPSYTPAARKSGTKIALDYAVRKERQIILLSP